MSAVRGGDELVDCGKLGGLTHLYNIFHSQCKRLHEFFVHSTLAVKKTLVGRPLRSSSFTDSLPSRNCLCHSNIVV